MATTALRMIETKSLDIEVIQQKIRQESAFVERLLGEVGRVIVGQRTMVERLLVGLLADGHVLMEGVPGLAKTLTVRTLARAIDTTFRRIQFTPDLLPADITGSAVYNGRTQEFTFSPGPIFANVVLADEINRTTPRTQSSLLEGMNDFQVSVDGSTYPLPRPFIVLATQNPYEYEGTYPLPESQLDRFLLKIRIGYPEAADEKRLLEGHRLADRLAELSPVVTADDVLRIQEHVRSIAVEQSVVDYAMEIVSRTRRHERLAVGVSPRGFLGLVRGAQALAAIEGRDFCLPDDVKRLAVPILSHRVIARRRSESPAVCAGIIQEVVNSVEVPV